MFNKTIAIKISNIPAVFCKRKVSLNITIPATVATMGSANASTEAFPGSTYLSPPV